MNKYANIIPGLRINKIALLLVFSFFIVWVIGYLTGNSRLELVNSSDETIVVFIRGDDYQQKLELNAKEKRT